MKQLIYFSAKLCTTCTNTSPLVEQLDKSKVSVTKIDVDYDTTLVEHYGIKSVPTLVVLEDGHEIKRHVGGFNQQSLNSIING